MTDSVFMLLETVMRVLGGVAMWIMFLTAAGILVYGVAWFVAGCLGAWSGRRRRRRWDDGLGPLRPGDKLIGQAGDKVDVTDEGDKRLTESKKSAER